MNNHDCYIYSWHLDVKEKDYTSIRIYGLDEKNNTICLKIKDFNPYCYVELPLYNEKNEFINWKQLSNIQKLGDELDKILKDKYEREKITIIQKELTYKKKLYYAHIDKDNKFISYPYLKLTFTIEEYRKKLKYILDKKFYINKFGNLKYTVHEYNADPLLQLRSVKDIPSTGWVKISGKKIEKENQETSCEFEYVVSYKNILKIEKNIVPKARLLSFDIEVYSSNPNRMPLASEMSDKIFQISCIMINHGDNVETSKKILLTLGQPDQKTTGEDVIIRKYTRESDMINGFTTLINEENPNVIIGYNIFMFDNKYIHERAINILRCFNYDIMGFLKNKHCDIIESNWSSSAYSNQKIYYLNTEGRIFVDLLPVIKREYSLNNYKLKTVSTFFLGVTKDPLTHKDIFKCYEEGVKNRDKNGIKGDKALGLCGKYCVQDSMLVLKLFEKLQLWIGLSEQANTFNVPITYLYTKGQQIKVYSQIYKKCLNDNIIVESDTYKVSEKDICQGANVLDGIAGIHEYATSFDFQSLYPSIIIAYNIDPTTLVLDEKIPDSKCNIIEWDEHLGCEHDKKIIRKKQLNLYIDGETKKINELKTKLTKCYTKLDKIQLKEKIDDLKKDLKKYQQERSVLLKHKPKHILCNNRKYRWLKEPKGLFPTLLKNLLDARKNTREQIKQIEKKIPTLTSEQEKNELETLVTVLDKRQLAYKISANSMYGAMGVRKGFLPFMVGAMCVTAMGRKNINIAADTIKNKYGGVIIYGDTDSNYVVFPDKKTYKSIWDWAIYVSAEVSKLFPDPIKLEFEKKIFALFFMITKKRYMYLELNPDNSISEKIGKKGVLLARRDNAVIIREIYSKIVMAIFRKTDMDELLYLIITELNKLCCFYYGSDKFVITKSVKDTNNLQVKEMEDEKGLSITKIGDYKVKKLSDDPNERLHQFQLKDCETAEEYYLHSLGAHIQLAEKIRKRGGRVDVGERLEYVITTNGGHKAKQYKKLESLEYFKRHSNILRIDYLYYVKQLVPSIDQCCDIIMNNEDFQHIKGFVKQQYNIRLIKQSVIEELKIYASPKIIETI